MKHILTRSLSLSLALISTVSADLRPQPQVEFTKGTAGTYNAEWVGITERTYFVEWSRDLKDWSYLPFMAFGIAPEGVHSYGGDSDADTFFLRLKFADIPTINAELADYDIDGLSNIDELSLGTDPLDPDTDHDGIPDGVEVANGGNPSSNTDGDPFRAADSDSDGLNDTTELAMGTSPTVRDSDGDGYNDNVDAFPLDPNRHISPNADPGDATGPLVTVEAPENAVFVSGP